MKNPGLQAVLKGQFVAGYKKGHSDGIQFTLDKYSAVVLKCLKDKFDFEPDQLQEAVIHINDDFDSIVKGYMSFEDVVQTLQEETGLDLINNGIASFGEGESNAK